MYWIGYDIGSSSIKAALVSTEDGSVKLTAQYPEGEMQIDAPKPGWAEQNPELWWRNLCLVSQKLLTQSGVKRSSIKGVGISYQMHGLVLVDKDLEVLRPSIIWCDSRAVQLGEDLFQKAGEQKCINRLLNSPGNFTLSKLKWVKDNEPELFEKVHKFLLPGDFIAMRLTGQCVTTVSGLSEGIMWDFAENKLADWIFQAAGIDPKLRSEVLPTFSDQGRVNPKAAKETGLPEGIPIMYRAGDQPNNALALNVLEPGEIAATGGTSGVVYAIADKASTSEGQRINCFAHVNHSSENTRIGKMLCINGTGIQYSWLRNQFSHDLTYLEMNQLAEQVKVGADGLRILPFGNGAERMLFNQNKGARILNLNFNRHGKAHLLRAALEGIAFSFVYGLEILREDGVDISSIKAGNDNLFQAQIFSNSISTLMQSSIKVIETTGAVGAARAAAYAFGDFSSIKEASTNDSLGFMYEPSDQKDDLLEAYELWKVDLNEYLI